MADATTPNTSNRVGSPHPTGSVPDDPATELLLPLRATTAVDADGDAGDGYNDDDDDDDETVGEDDVFMVGVEVVSRESVRFYSTTIPPPRMGVSQRTVAKPVRRPASMRPAVVHIRPQSLTQNGCPGQ